MHAPHERLERRHARRAGEPVPVGQHDDAARVQPRPPPQALRALGCDVDGARHLTAAEGGQRTGRSSKAAAAAGRAGPRSHAPCAPSRDAGDDDDDLCAVRRRRAHLRDCGDNAGFSRGPVWAVLGHAEHEDYGSRETIVVLVQPPRGQEPADCVRLVFTRVISSPVRERMRQGKRLEAHANRSRHAGFSVAVLSPQQDGQGLCHGYIVGYNGSRRGR